MALLSWWHAANASAVKSCDTIVEVLEKVECISNTPSCEINFKSKCTFNNRGHSMGNCKFKDEIFKTMIKISKENITFNKGDNIKLSYFLVCHEEGCNEPKWEYVGIESCGFWRSIF